jgi:hypothetical protein
MPKSNFSQFLDECEDDVRAGEKKSISKISFETKSPPPHCNHDEYENQTIETNQTNNENNNNIKTLNTSNSISNAAIRRCSDGGRGSGVSSNIFLSKSANNHRERFDRFSTQGQRMNSFTNATATASSIKSVQTNIFKSSGDNDSSHSFNSTQTATATATPTSTSVVEINNETFPSLTSARTTTAAATNGGNSIPKKFKNFKDAICASAPAPAPLMSPKKQKQTRMLPISTIPPPVVVKRDSELYAKKMLAKTKNIAAFYDDDDNDDDNDDDCDDDDDGDDIRRFGRSRPTTFVKNSYYGDDSD